MNKQLQKILQRLLWISAISLIIGACGGGTQTVNNTPTVTSMPWLENTLTPTEFPSPTIPSTPIPTKTILPTQKPSQTPHPSATPTDTVKVVSVDDYGLLAPLAAPPMILYIDESHLYIYLQNIVTGEAWPLLPPVQPGMRSADYHAYHFVNWSEDGCELMMAEYGKGGNLRRFDLHGNVLQELISFQYMDILVWNITLDPLEDMVAIEGIANPSILEDNDSTPFLDIVELNNLNNWRRISENNVIMIYRHALAWSPDGKWIAYAEQDASQVIQIFIARVDGSDRRQLTNFNNPKAILSNFKWSTDGKRLAFLYDENIDDPDLALAYVSTEGQEQEATFIEVEGILKVVNYWWQGPQVMVLHSGSVYWVDITTGEVLHVLKKSSVPEGYITTVEPLANSNLVGLNSNSVNNFYIYDPSTQVLEHFPNAGKPYESTLEEWILSPAGFNGIESCIP
jgi:hypothetical protein